MRASEDADKLGEAFDFRSNENTRMSLIYEGKPARFQLFYKRFTSDRRRQPTTADLMVRFRVAQMDVAVARLFSLLKDLKQALGIIGLYLHLDGIQGLLIGGYHF